MKIDDQTPISELSDEALEIATGIEHVPTILNASYCLTCWGEEGAEEQGFPAVTALDSSSAAAPVSLSSSEHAKRAMFESSEVGVRITSHHVSDLVHTEDTSLDKFCHNVSDEALEAAAHQIWANDTLGLTLAMPLAPAPCC